MIADRPVQSVIIGSPWVLAPIGGEENNSSSFTLHAQVVFVNLVCSIVEWLSGALLTPSVTEGQVLSFPLRNTFRKQ